MDNSHKAQHTGSESVRGPVHLTPAAVAEVKRLLAEQKSGADTRLRVGVTGGGCGGLTYKMEFDGTVGDNDRVIEIEGLQVIVDAKSLPYMEGTIIDYSREMLTGGFKFDNPHSARNCGCGTSFTV